MHFDVFLPSGGGLDLAREKAMQWLATIDVVVEYVVLESCELCHVEDATPEYAAQVNELGYAILQMENCPSPI